MNPLPLGANVAWWGTALATVPCAAAWDDAHSQRLRELHALAESRGIEL